MKKKSGLILSLVVAILAISAVGTGARADDRNASARLLAKHGGVGIITGGVDGTYLRIAADLAAVLDGDSELRILPTIGKGSVQNLFDLRYLRNIDIAIVQSDALAFIRQDPSTADVSDYIRYVTKLYNEEFQVLAAKDIQSLADLRDKKVSTDVVGSGTGMTADIVFHQLGIPIVEQHLNQADAIQALKSGDVSAVVFVAGKPAKLFTSIDGASGMHFLSVSPTPGLLATYLPAELSHEDYPQLIPEGASVDTIAVGAVMAIYNLNIGTPRYKQAAMFVDAFFGKFDKFLDPQRHPKWHEVSLTADLPGWKRFQPAMDWLAQHDSTRESADDATRRSFDAYLEKRGGVATNASSEERAALYVGFEQWQKERDAAAARTRRSSSYTGEGRSRSRSTGVPTPE